MIVYTPLDLPRIEPDDWDVFWDIWNKYSGPLVKEKSNWEGSVEPVGRTGLWTGLDIYSIENNSGWTAPFYDIRLDLPDMFSSLEKLSIPNISKVRLVSSEVPFGSHSDDNRDHWAIRGFLHYPSKISQWYFTKPGDRQGERSYITLPNNVMWFSYNDKHSWHGTTYDPDYKKILIQITYKGSIQELLNQSIEKYKEYTLQYD